MSSLAFIKTAERDVVEMNGEAKRWGRADESRIVNFKILRERSREAVRKNKTSTAAASVEKHAFYLWEKLKIQLKSRIFMLNINEKKIVHIVKKRDFANNIHPCRASSQLSSRCILHT